MADHNFNADLVAALGEIPVIHKDASNPFFNSSYLTLDGIINTVRPILAKHHLALIQNIWAVGDGMACRTTILHTSGQQLQSDVLIFPCLQKDPQKIASLITYLKRYQMAAFLGIATDQDDDGNAASKPAAPAKPVPTNKSKKTAGDDFVDF
jgi:hypothetical protein